MRPPLVPARVALLGALALGACGFHPRGSLVALDDPGRLFLDTDRGLSIEQELREALAERAFTLAPDRDAADIVLRVADERQTQRIVSVRSTGRVSEYELGHGVSMAIARTAEPPASTLEGLAGDSAAAGPVVEPRRADRVQVTREYTYDESQVLGKENEARILRGEMREELVRQIVLRTLASLAHTAEERDGPG